jgi:DNA-binding response OmpR family regulator
MNSHILVVEDNAKARIALATRLQSVGYQVTQAQDGETAIDLLESEIFDLVLTDIVMGAVDGIEVLHTARLQPYQPEVILLTGHGTLDTCIAAVREGANEYLLKPCQTEVLLASVERAIQRHASQQQVREAATTLFHVLSAQQGNVDPSASPQLASFGNPSPANMQYAQRGGTRLQVGDLIIGNSRKNVLFRGEAVRLTPIEYALARYLAEHQGEVCRCCDIVGYTHNINVSDSDAQPLLRAHIRNLRKKLDPDYIVNDRGIGYMLVYPSASDTSEFSESSDSSESADSSELS